MGIKCIDADTCSGVEESCRHSDVADRKASEAPIILLLAEATVVPVSLRGVGEKARSRKLKCPIRERSPPCIMTSM